MRRGVDDAEGLATLLADSRITAVALGPGCGVDRAGAMLDPLLASKRPCVLDADALTALAARGLEGLHEGCVLTPHAGEMAQLTGLDCDEIEARREAVAVEYAGRLDAVLLVKGSTTLIASPGGELAIYGGGGVGLATGGSGDVLTGIIAGLTARGLPAWEAACWGVWLHGEAGRRLAERMGPMGFLARELPGEIPALMRGV